MVTTTQIKRFSWVVELLLRRKHLTIEEINEEWGRSVLAENPGEELDRRSWYKCFYDIGLIYGILIELVPPKRSFHYCILNPEDLKGRNVQQWMMGCVAHRNLLEECLGMHNRIDIDEFPSENGMLEVVATAMKENRKLEMSYRRYGKVPKKYIVEPYFIKTYKQRFYVLCKFDSGMFYTLSFDRIDEARMLKEKFSFPNNMFAKDYFEYAFGVMVPPAGEEPQRIVVRAKGDARYYLEDVPLHKSQQIIREEDDYADFQLNIWATDDFIGAIMQQGNRLEIISPEPVRLKIKEQMEKALQPYLAA